MLVCTNTHAFLSTRDCRICCPSFASQVFFPWVGQLRSFLAWELGHTDVLAFTLWLLTSGLVSLDLYCLPPLSLRGGTHWTYFVQSGRRSFVRKAEMEILLGHFFRAFATRMNLCATVVFTKMGDINYWKMLPAKARPRTGLHTDTRLASSEAHSPACSLTRSTRRVWSEPINQEWGRLRVRPWREQGEQKLQSLQHEREEK